MGLARGIVGMVGVAGLRGWRSAFDFEAPGLDARERLVRMEYAAWRAWEQSSDPADRRELEFILGEARGLLRLPLLEGEVAERERVGQRMERVRRVVLHHEGRLARLNRRYWWVPCGLGLLLMLSCCGAPLIGL